MNLGVKTADSRDSAERTRFHCFDIFTHMRGEYPPWYYEYDANGAKKVKFAGYKGGRCGCV